MFDIGWSELLVIAVVAIIVVGPKDLPRLMRTFGQYAGKLRRMAADFQNQFEDAMREAEVEEVRKAMESVRDATPAVDLRAPIDRPVMLPKPQAGSTPAASSAAPAVKAGRKANSAKARKTHAPKTQAPKTRVSKKHVSKTRAAKTRVSKGTPRKGTPRKGTMS
jgi:sec-independent protein translocase protein TatB